MVGDYEEEDLQDLSDDVNEEGKASTGYTDCGCCVGSHEGETEGNTNEDCHERVDRQPVALCELGLLLKFAYWKIVFGPVR